MQFPVIVTILSGQMHGLYPKPVIRMLLSPFRRFVHPASSRSRRIREAVAGKCSRR
jgi:hypothetical protein